MNILFIEDEKALAETGVLQLEQRGHRVLMASGVAEGRELLADPSNEIDCVIADHRLGDGFGINFVIDAKAVNPNREYAIVSGFLSDENIADLKLHSIPYFRKPLLYSHVLDQLRKARMARKAAEKAKEPGEPEPQPEPQAPVEQTVLEEKQNDVSAVEAAPKPRATVFGKLRRKRLPE